ncbi:MAG: zinc ribbon domain-containing protein [bacterium]
MSLDEYIKGETLKSLRFYGDSASKTFYEKLAEKKFETTKCRDCGEVFFPPRVLCPHCLSTSLEWTPLSGRGVLYAFSWQERGVRFVKPDVLGLVDLEDCAGRIFSRIAGKYEDLGIGMPLRIDFVEVHPGFFLHQFVPDPR